MENLRAVGTRGTQNHLNGLLRFDLGWDRLVVQSALRRADASDTVVFFLVEHTARVRQDLAHVVSDVTG